MKSSPPEPQKTKGKVWRDAKGRFASPVYFDGKRYRDARSGKVSVFATASEHPSRVAKARRLRPIKPQKPPRFPKPAKPSPKPPRKSVKAPKVPTKGKPLGKPGKPARKPPKAVPRKLVKKPKKKPPKEALKLPQPPKTFIGQIFGKNRRHLLRPLTREDRKRIKEAKDAIEEAGDYARRNRQRFGPTEKSPLGYEWHQLIAAVEKMSPHDVYTLFMSP